MSSASEPVTRLAQRLANEQRTTLVAFGTEAGIFKSAGIPTVVCGPGSITQAHQPDEYVTLEQLARCEEFLRGLRRDEGDPLTARGMKRIALGLLGAAALLYAAATALEAATCRRGATWRHSPRRRWSARSPTGSRWWRCSAIRSGLPIPHTAIIPSNKDRIGDNLAGFICDNFLSTEQVLAKLAQFDPAARLAALARASRATPRSSARTCRRGAALRARRPSTTSGCATSSRQRWLRPASRRSTCRAWPARLLDALTADGRHQRLLDDVLRQVARVLEDETIKARRHRGRRRAR